MKTFLALITLVILSLNSFAASASDVGSPAAQELRSAKKVYFVLASAAGAGRSMAGHSYLRVGFKDLPSNDDLMVEFLADTNDADMSYIRALGFWNNYDRKVTVEKYATVKHSMNIVANRDLTSYELSLSEPQKNELLNLLTKYISSGKMGDYSFLSANCAQAVSSLFQSIGIDLSWPVNIVPFMIPQALREKTLIKNVYRDESLIRQRLLLTLRYKDLISKYLPNHFDKLKSLSFSDRVSAFILLSQSAENADLTEKGKIKSYLYMAILLESKFVRDELLTHVNGQKKFNISRPISTNITLPSSISLPGKMNVGDSTLQYKNGHLEIEYNLSIDGQQAMKFSRTLKDDEVQLRGYDIRVNDVAIGYVVSNEMSKTNVILLSGWHHEEDLAYNKNGTVSVTTLFFSETPKTLETKDLGYLQESNLKNINANRPMCYGLVEFQKRLMEQIIWVPEAQRLSRKENFLLAKDLMNNKVIVVPGFSSPREWTESLDEESLSKFLFSIHKERYAGPMSAMGIYFKRIEITPEDLNFIIKKARQGIYTPVFFKTTSGYGHAILITGISVIKGALVTLKAYDPNVRSTSGGISGFTKDVFTLDMERKTISSFGYGTSELYSIPQDIESEAMIRNLVTDPVSKKLLIGYSGKSGKHSFSLSEIALAF